MNEYELMLLRSEEALANTITGLIKKVIKSKDEEAREELATISKTINYDVNISCEAYFEPHANTLNATASFSSLEDFEDADGYCDGYSHDFESEYGIQWDDDCGYGDFSLEKYDPYVEVFIDGLTDKASEKLIDAYNNVCKKEMEAQQKKTAAERVEKLRKELEEAQALLDIC